MDQKFSSLPDVQSLADGRNIPIDRVGVRDLTVPLTIASINGPQPTIAEVSMYVGLPADKKGTHMSRFVSLIADDPQPLSSEMMRGLLERMLELLGAEEGYIDIRCPFFVTKSSPVSKLKSLMNYKVRFVAERKKGKTRVLQEITAPVTSLCPCSRESASCELWSRLKRNDEKYVTEYAYDHPKFVEDIVRDTAKQLNAEPRVLAYHTEAENFESIHNHSAYAQIERDKRLG